MNKGKRILSITVKRMLDDSPDTSHLGEFSNSADSDYAIEHNGGYREYSYFNPNYQNYEGCSESEIRKYCEQDYQRAVDYGNGWVYIGIRAEAEIQLVANSTIQCITSGGLWGIESDSDDEYIAEIESEELANLRTQLHALGFSQRAISAAFRTIQHKEAA